MTRDELEQLGMTDESLLVEYEKYHRLKPYPLRGDSADERGRRALFYDDVLRWRAYTGPIDASARKAGPNAVDFPEEHARNFVDY